MQGKWKLWPHSAVNIAVPCPVFTLCAQIPHLLLENRRPDLSKEKVDGERGDDGAERWNSLVLLLVLHW